MIKCEIITSYDTVYLQEKINEFFSKNPNIEIIHYETKIGTVVWKSPYEPDIEKDHDMMVTIIYEIINTEQAKKN